MTQLRLGYGKLMYISISSRVLTGEIQRKQKNGVLQQLIYSALLCDSSLIWGKSRHIYWLFVNIVTEYKMDSLYIESPKWVKSC